MKTLAYIILLGAVIMPAPAAEPGRATGELLKSCRKAVAAFNGDAQYAPVESGFCIGYVSGFRDALPETAVCVPREVTNEQLARVFVTWADANPGIHHRDQIVGMMAALYSSFPCE
jgi:hypothetical protein